MCKGVGNIYLNGDIIFDCNGQDGIPNDSIDHYTTSVLGSYVEM
jgi:hypothetical protein